MITPEEAGIPSAAVERFLDRLEKEELCMHGFLLQRDGETLAEGYWAPFSKKRPHRMYSVSKSMTSLAVGLLEAEGRLRLEDRICDYFPDKLPEDPAPELTLMTIRDMLRMATCHEKTTYKQAADADWTRTFFTVKPGHRSGAVFSYDTSATHTLGALVERLNGRSLLDFLRERLFSRLGMNGEMRWLKDPVGVCQGGSGLVMTLEDLARAAAFCLAGGKGTALEGYLHQATALQIETPLRGPSEERHGYGYQFWRVREGGFAMYGMGGQLAVCLPQKRLVLCTTADTQLDPNGVQKIYDAFFTEIYPFAGKALAPDETAVRRLRDRCEALAMRPLYNRPEFACPVAARYDFSKNPIGLERLSMGGGRVCLEGSGLRHDFPLGMGEWREETLPWLKEPGMACAGWIAPSLMRCVCYLTGDTLSGMEMLLSFHAEGVTLEMKCAKEGPLGRYEGIVTGMRRNSL